MMANKLIDGDVLKVIKKANELFVKSKYGECLQLLQEFSRNRNDIKLVGMYEMASVVHFKLNNYYQCVVNADKAIRLSPNLQSCLLRKARALARMEDEFENARDAYRSFLDGSEFQRKEAASEYFDLLVAWTVDTYKINRQLAESLAMNGEDGKYFTNRRPNDESSIGQESKSTLSRSSSRFGSGLGLQNGNRSISPPILPTNEEPSASVQNEDELIQLHDDIGLESKSTLSRSSSRFGSGLGLQNGNRPISPGILAANEEPSASVQNQDELIQLHDDIGLESKSTLSRSSSRFGSGFGFHNGNRSISPGILPANEEPSASVQNQDELIQLPDDIEPITSSYDDEENEEYYSDDEQFWESDVDIPTSNCSTGCPAQPIVNLEESVAINSNIEPVNRELESENVDNSSNNSNGTEEIDNRFLISEPREPTNLFNYHGVYLRNIARSCTYWALREVFKKFGFVNNVVIDKYSQSAQIFYTNPESPVKAIVGLWKYDIIDKVNDERTLLELKFCPSPIQERKLLEPTNECLDWRTDGCFGYCTLLHYEVNRGIDYHGSVKK